MAVTDPENNTKRVLREVFHEAVDSLTPVYGTGEATAMVRIIFENIQGWSSVDLAIKANEVISPFICQCVNNTVLRLLNHEPIQYIFGNAWFYGMKFKVSQDTLIPRPETAELVDIIVKENKGAVDLRVLDLCTGTGCIAIALSRNLPFSNVTGIDISDKALMIAKENASVLHSNVDFRQIDILDVQSCKFADGYDIIVSNPPYISQREKPDMDQNVIAYEPHIALFVDDSEPLIFYEAIFRIAGRHLTENGKVYCEINPLFATEVRELAIKSGLDETEIVRDSYGKNRFLIASRH